MRARVIKSFRDRNKKTLHKKGDTITVSKERFEELSSAARGPFVEDASKKSTKDSG